LNAQTVINTIERESTLLGTKPNLWLGYNALNEILHGKFKQNFNKQKEIDTQIFEYLLESVS
jgi:hypothetical protein